MNCKELSLAAGISKSNILYYESEGFITPIRNYLNFRDYVPSDVLILKRMKLLRCLHIDLQTIKQLHQNEISLSCVLENHLKKLEMKDDAVILKQICQYLIKNSEEYQTFDTEYYLARLDEQALKPFDLSDDKITFTFDPFYRLCARVIDLGIYHLCYLLVMNLVFHMNYHHLSHLKIILSIVTMMVLTLLIEPVLLHFFKTTFGKWIFRIQVTDENRNALSIKDAFIRTWSVLLLGLGLGIPFFNLFRLYVCYDLYRENEELSWMNHNVLTQKPIHPFRFVSIPLLYFIRTIILMLVVLIMQLPVHRGQISTLEFIDNRNRLAIYHDVHSLFQLKQDGTYTSLSQGKDGDFKYLPNLKLVEQNGELTSVSFSVHLENIEYSVPSYGEEMILYVLSFIGAQEATTPLTFYHSNILDYMYQYQNEGFKFSLSGVDVTCTVIYHNLTPILNSPPFLHVIKDGPNSFDLEFTMIKN